MRSRGPLYLFLEQQSIQHQSGPIGFLDSKRSLYRIAYVPKDRINHVTQQNCLHGANDANCFEQMHYQCAQWVLARGRDLQVCSKSGFDHLPCSTKCKSQKMCKSCHTMHLILPAWSHRKFRNREDYVIFAGYPDLLNSNQPWTQRPQTESAQDYNNGHRMCSGEQLDRVPTLFNTTCAGFVI